MIFKLNRSFEVNLRVWIKAIGHRLCIEWPTSQGRLTKLGCKSRSLMYNNRSIEITSLSMDENALYLDEPPIDS